MSFTLFCFKNNAHKEKTKEILIQQIFSILITKWTEFQRPQ